MASQHGQAAAIVGGLAPEDRWPRLVEVITDEADLVHASFARADGPSLPNTDVGVGSFIRDGHPAEPWWDTGREVVRAQPFFRYVCTTRSSPPVAPTSSPGSAATGPGPSSAARPRSPRPGTAAPSATAGRPRPPATSCSGCSASSRPSPGSRVARVEPALGDLEWAEGAVPTPAGLLHVAVRDGAVVIDSPIPFDHAGRRHPAGRHTFP